MAGGRGSVSPCLYTISAALRSPSAASSGNRRCLATVYLGLGSNVGDRHANLLRAYKGLRELGDVDATSFLYETPPMYMEDQPRFLNAACRLSTELDPATLLDRIKSLEAAVGRVESTRWGPRAVDVDILTYNELVLDGESRWLQIPHPRMHERPFVLLPLVDIEPGLVHPSMKLTVEELLRQSSSAEDLALGVGGERVLPMGRRSRTYVMGILNATPDSFSDGGQHGGTAAAVEHALSMAREGADIVDVGGEPGATEISAEEEISRVVPVIEGIRDASSFAKDGQGVTISVDTRRAAVAEAAVAAGAHAVNDVSGGRFDPEMFAAVARAEIPLIMMHMRGTPTTMTSLTDYGGNVVAEVLASLQECSRAAESAGIPRWMHVLDPGIGFAKTHSQSLLLLQRLDSIAARVGSPLLVGPSRKRFVGELTGESDPSRRDWGTIGACCSAAERGAKIVRVHNVKGAAQALAVSDAIQGKFQSSLVESGVK
eukprot:jgi/Undpi1/13931/HiC_scaffold_9.g03582.m1